MLLLMEIYMHYRNSINPHDVICKIVYSASKHPDEWILRLSIRITTKDTTVSLC